LFRFYDELKLGYITEEQYNEGCRILAESDHREYTPWTQQAFDNYDCSYKDGYVTMDEFLRYILNQYYPEHETEETAKAE